MANIWILILLFFFKGDQGNNHFRRSPHLLNSENDMVNKNISDVEKKNHNEGPWVKSLKKTNRNIIYITEIEIELKKIDDLWEKSLITEEEKNNMRNKILGLS